MSFSDSTAAMFYIYRDDIMYSMIVDRVSKSMSTVNHSSNSRNSSGGSYGYDRRRTTARHTSNYQGQRTYRGSSGSSHHRRRRRRNTPNYGIIAAVGVVLMIVIAAAVYGLKSGKQREAVVTTEETSATEPETELVKEVTVDGIAITGMSRDEAKAEILKKYVWGMKVHYQDQVYEVANLLEGKLDELLEDIYRGEPEERYLLDISSGMEEQIQTQVDQMKGLWNQSAKNGSISSYDAASDSFVFEGEVVGVAIDEEKLTADIQKALAEKNFTADITAQAHEVQPEIPISAAKEKYKTIGKYTTNTTSNSKRNTNIRLAAEALNGTIVYPGQEMSFNEVVGQRTAEKGYQGAAAYSGGEVVEEIGGGVCQVSTTLYNAVVRAGLKVSVRRSHTFAPSYVTPGMDATVSWGGPEFKFVNTSSAAIGVRAAYSNQTVTVSIYGIPVLEEGVTHELESKKIEDIPIPAPTYEEDQTIAPGTEVVKSNGSQGSRWETRLIVKKNGEVISNDVDHTVTYKGHNPVIRRNSTDVMLNENGEVVVPTESSDSSAADATQTTDNSTQPESSSAQQPTAPVTPGDPGGPGGPGGPGSAPEQPDSMGPPGTAASDQPASPGGDSSMLAVPKPED